jgi:pyruvate-formate lyase-activating enzyme
MNIAKITIGFIEIPHKVCLNVFVQGCKYLCDGCQNPNFQEFNSKDSINVDEKQFQRYLFKSDGLIQGICWLGGDAIFQPKDLISFSTLAKEHKLFSVLYTGTIFENINNKIKNSQDGIIDGLYNGHPLGNIKCNQKIYVKKENTWNICESLVELSTSL